MKKKLIFMLFNININKYFFYTIKKSGMSDSQSEINKIKAKTMYARLIAKYNNIKDAANEENIIKKIIELNFDEMEIKGYYDMERIYNELEDEYGISGFIDEDAMKDKIKELNYDKELIKDWIESVLLDEF